MPEGPSAGRVTLGWVGRQAAGWMVLVVGATLALATLAAAVEHSELGLVGALSVGLAGAPAVVLPLLSLCVAMGATLAAVRLDLTGEAGALEALGWSPWRTGRALLLLGLALGGLQWALVGSLAPRGVAWAEARLGVEQTDWLWVSGVAVRLSDGQAWQVVDGRLSPTPSATLDSDEVELARQRVRPRLASHTALQGATSTAALVERENRLARVLSCTLWALLGWLPLGRLRASRRVALLGGLALAWAAVDLGMQVLAAQRLVPVGVGGWGGAALLLGVLAASRFSRLQR